MERELTLVEAEQKFSEVVDRVRRGESTRLTEDGRVIARVVPADHSPACKTGAELLLWWNDPNRPRLTPEEAEEFEHDLEEGRRILLPPKEDPWE